MVHTGMTHTEIGMDEELHTETEDAIGKGRESEIPAVCRFLKGFLDYGICLYLILLLAVMPLYSQDGYSHIGTDKAVFFCKVSAVFCGVLLPAAVLYLVMRAAGKRKSGSALQPFGMCWKRTDFFAALYGAALVISYFCSRYREVALWGAVRG